MDRGTQERHEHPVGPWVGRYRERRQFEFAIPNSRRRGQSPGQRASALPAGNRQSRLRQQRAEVSQNVALQHLLRTCALREQDLLPRQPERQQREFLWNCDPRWAAVRRRDAGVHSAPVGT